MATTKGNVRLGRFIDVDESAAIFLYTSEWQPQEQCLYGALNTMLR